MNGLGLEMMMGLVCVVVVVVSVIVVDRWVISGWDMIMCCMDDFLVRGECDGGV